MAQIIPFSSRQAIGRSKPPTGNSAEILRTIGQPEGPKQTLKYGDKGWYVMVDNKSNPGKVRLAGPFSSQNEAAAEMQRLSREFSRFSQMKNTDMSIENN